MWPPWTDVPPSSPMTPSTNLDKTFIAKTQSTENLLMLPLCRPTPPLSPLTHWCRWATWCWRSSPACSARGSSVLSAVSAAVCPSSTRISIGNVALLTACTTTRCTVWCTACFNEQCTLHGALHWTLHCMLHCMFQCLLHWMLPCTLHYMLYVLHDALHTDPWPTVLCTACFNEHCTAHFTAHFTIHCTTRCTTRCTACCTARCTKRCTACYTARSTACCTACCTALCTIRCMSCTLHWTLTLGCLKVHGVVPR